MHRHVWKIVSKEIQLSAYDQIVASGQVIRDMDRPGTALFEHPVIVTAQCVGCDSEKVYRAIETSTARAVDHRSAYGLTARRSRAETETLMEEGLAECARVARSWVLVKCCDYAENPTTFRLGHVTTIVAGEALGLRVHDLFVLGGSGGPTNHRIRVIRRARRAHSYLLVFARPKRLKAAA